jgi:ABC-type molybdate transport system substrate-binding protein
MDRDAIADIRKRMQAGETADVIILSRPVMDELGKQDKFAPDSVIDVAGTPVALAIRVGSPKPDISTVEALKKTLLSAKSIVYADPAKGGAAGAYFAHVTDQLGIADQLKSKTIRCPAHWAQEWSPKAKPKSALLRHPRSGRGRASARPFAGRVRQHDSLHGRHRRFEPEPGCSQIAHPISHRTGREARSQRERLPARMTSATAARFMPKTEDD